MEPDRCGELPARATAPPVVRASPDSESGSPAVLEPKGSLDRFDFASRAFARFALFRFDTAANRRPFHAMSLQHASPPLDIDAVIIELASGI